MHQELTPDQLAAAEAEAPVWHRGFLQMYRKDMAEVKTQMNDRLVGVERQSTGMAHAMALDDPREIRLTGVPVVEGTSRRVLASKVLNFLGFENPDQLIVSHRDWTQNSTNRPSTTASTNSSCAVVIELVSAGVRDSVLRKSSKLRDKKASEVLGVGGNSPIYVNAIWPQPVYTLLREARTVCKTLNYVAPVVKNLIVHVRQSKDSVPIPIYSSADLQMLPCTNTTQSNNPISD